MNRLDLRPYRTGDLEELVRLFYDTVHIVNAADYPPEQLDVWAPGALDRERWDRSLSGRCSIVAEWDGLIAGFGDITPDGYLDRLYVRWDCQRRGIGGRICGVLEEYARQTGVPAVTTHASITARPFFESRGYRILREQQVERGGLLLTNFVMERPLCCCGEQRGRES